MPEDPRSANLSPAGASSDASSSASADTSAGVSADGVADTSADASASTGTSLDIPTVIDATPEISHSPGFNLEYAPAPESTAILRLKDSYGLFINGELSEPGDSVIPSTNPATGERIADFTPMPNTCLLYTSPSPRD